MGVKQHHGDCCQGDVTSEVCRHGNRLLDAIGLVQIISSHKNVSCGLAVRHLRGWSCAIATVVMATRSHHGNHLLDAIGLVQIISSHKNVSCGLAVRYLCGRSCAMATVVMATRRRYAVVTVTVTDCMQVVRGAEAFVVWIIPAGLPNSRVGPSGGSVERRGNMEMRQECSQGKKELTVSQQHLKQHNKIQGDPKTVTKCHFNITT